MESDLLVSHQSPMLLLEIIQKISEYCDIRTKLNIQASCAFFNENIIIRTFYDELSFSFGGGFVVRSKASNKITLEVLNKHKHITELMTPMSIGMTTNTNLLKVMKQINTLYINCSCVITNEMIKDMKLTELYLGYYSHITDEGIRNMDLKILCASNNEGITDIGIKDMKLHILYASGGCRITDTGIENQKGSLHTLCAAGIFKITNSSIKTLKNLHTLDASYNPQITDEGIKDMKLIKVIAYGNDNITNKYNNIEQLVK